MKKRMKNPVITPVSHKEADRLMAKYAEVDAKLEELQAQMDQEINEIRERYAERLNALAKERTECFDRLQFYAELNRDKLFVKKKSFEFPYGSIGFRLGTPKVKLLRGFTWAKAMEKIKTLMPGYVVIKEAPNKELMIANREELTKNGLLKQVGCQVVQEETFFIELKKEVNDNA